MNPDKTQIAIPPNPNPEKTESISRLLITTLISILIIFIILFLINIFWKDEINSAAQWLYEHIKIYGLVSTILITDSLTSPIPPDVVLVILKQNDVSPVTPLIIISVVSVIAGSIGYFLGKKFGLTAFGQRLLGSFRVRGERLFARYGVLAVILGAMTPLPFSFTCWSAGIFNLRYLWFFIASLSRIPRIFLYYWIIDFAVDGF